MKLTKRIDKISLTIKNLDGEHASISVTFSPKLSGDDDVEITPNIILLNTIMSIINDDEQSETPQTLLH